MLKVVLLAAALCAVSTAQNPILPILTALANSLSTCNQRFLCDYNRTTTSETLECVDKIRVCDGKKDCSGGQDELKCPPRCAVGQVICRQDRRTCANKCNNVNDCTPNSDEFNCPATCPAGQLLCNDRTTCTTPCSSVATQCPGLENQWNCGVDCPAGEFLCSDLKTCANKCNGERECPNAEDENCPFACLCERGQFYCGGAGRNQCIDRRLVCNEIEFECEDNSDESSCN